MDRYYWDGERFVLASTAQHHDREVARLREENERLRQAIKDAPHDEDCQRSLYEWEKRRFGETDIIDKCDCWKRKAMEGE